MNANPANEHTTLEDHDDFGGLLRDVPNLLDRRKALQWIGGASLIGLLAACGSDASTSASSGSDASSGSSGSSERGADASSASTRASAGEEIPNETQGPFPADGSNGPNVLQENGIVRSDITRSIGSASGTAEGVPANIQLTVVDAATGNPLAGAAVYLWHCTAGGQYSVYEVEDENYLRGIQVADDAGKVTFDSIFPGCYPGRWPHCHFEVYSSVDDTTAGSKAIKISQLALPQADCEAIYEDSRYGSSLANLGQLSLTSDMVFRDGWDLQLATVSGDATKGTAVSLLVRV